MTRCFVFAFFLKFYSERETERKDLYIDRSSETLAEISLRLTNISGYPRTMRKFLVSNVTLQYRRMLRSTKRTNYPAIARPEQLTRADTKINFLLEKRISRNNAAFALK